MRRAAEEAIGNTARRQRLNPPDLADNYEDISAQEAQEQPATVTSIASNDPSIVGASPVHTASSTPTNTPPIFYISDMALAGVCKETVEKIQADCPEGEGPTSQQPASNVYNDTLGANASAAEALMVAIDQDAKTRYFGGDGSPPNATWMDQHCQGQWMKPIKGNLSTTPSSTGAASPFNQMTALKNAIPSTSSLDLSDYMAYAAASKARKSPCLNARKCSLIPFNKTSAEDQAKNADGCCPGQTGHHVMPDAMFRKLRPTSADQRDYETRNGSRTLSGRDKKPTQDCWDNYTEGGAPTICLEGTSNHGGSHGKMHTDSTDALVDFIGSGSRSRNNVVPAHDEMPYTAARDAMAELVARNFGCSKECIAEQLDNYFKQAYSCDADKFETDAKVVPHSGVNADTNRARVPAPRQRPPGGFGS